MVYNLVRFVEDDILYVCPDSYVRKRPGSTQMIRFKQLGWFKAEIMSSGVKSEMIKQMENLQYGKQVNVNVHENYSAKGNLSQATRHNQLLTGNVPHAICNSIDICSISFSKTSDEDIGTTLSSSKITENFVATSNNSSVDVRTTQSISKITLYPLATSNISDDTGITQSTHSVISLNSSEVKVCSRSSIPTEVPSCRKRLNMDTSTSLEKNDLTNIYQVVDESNQRYDLECSSIDKIQSVDFSEDYSLSPLEEEGLSDDALQSMPLNNRKQQNSNLYPITSSYVDKNVGAIQSTSKNQVNPTAVSNAASVNVDMDVERAQSTSKMKVLSNIPLCSAIINANLNNGYVEIVVDRVLHKGIYSDSTFVDAENILTGIITKNDGPNHSCVSHEDNVSTGLLTLNVSTLHYECNVTCCMHTGTYQCQCYFVNCKNVLIGMIKLKSISLSSNSESPTLVEKSETPVVMSKKIFKRKRHYCPFCKTFQFAFGRHVVTQHQSEKEVKEIIAMPKGSNKRKKILSIVRCRGMHIYNMERNVIGGTKLVVRNPTVNNSESFVPCPNCNGYFSPRNVARHQKRCVNRPANKTQVLCMAKELQRPSISTNQVLLDNLLSQLREDEITNTIKNDKVLLLLASTMSVKYAKEKHLGNFMRQKLRQLSRLLLKIRDIDGQDTNFESCIVPAKYDIIKRAVYDLCELDPINFTYKRPSMAAQIGTMIKDIANVLKIQNIKDGRANSNQQQNIEDFLTIHEKEYGELVAKSAVTTLEQNKWNKQQVMPSVQDIQKFQDYIKLRAEDSYNSLRNLGFDYNIWLTLGKSCLLMLLTFNRRRVGEMSRILIENFENRQKIENDQYKTLNRLERILANKFQRMEIRGKKGRRVPLLLTSRHIKYIEVLLRFRTNAGVSVNNPYVFGVTHKKSYIDAGVVIRDYSMKCGASDSNTLRGTFLRKQVATISQMLNLSDNEIQQLADFMGHEVAIHRLHYRKPEISLQITRLSKFFMAVSGSDIEKYRGKTLEDLETMDSSNTNEVPHSDCSLSEDENTDTASPEFDEIEHGTPSRSETKKRQTRSQADIRSPLKSTPQKLKFHYPKLNVIGAIKSPVRRIVPRRIRWTTEECIIISEAFKYNLDNNTIPSFRDCATLRRKHHKILARRTVAQIKAWVYNHNKKLN